MKKIYEKSAQINKILPNSLACKPRSSSQIQWLFVKFTCFLPSRRPGGLISAVRRFQKKFWGTRSIRIFMYFRLVIFLERFGDSGGTKTASPKNLPSASPIKKKRCYIVATIYPYIHQNFQNFQIPSVVLQLLYYTILGATIYPYDYIPIHHCRALLRDSPAGRVAF